MTKRKLGEVLRDRGKISVEDLNAAIADQQGKIIRLGELLLERGLVDKADLASALEEVMRIPYLDIDSFQPSPELLGSLSKVVAERCSALPVELQGRKLTVIMADPQDLALLHDLRFNTGAEILPRLGFRDEIVTAIAKYYGAPQELPSTKETEAATKKQDAALASMEFISTSARLASREAFQEVQAELRNKRTPAVRVVSEVIQEALKRQASDIHIEPQTKDVVVRLRVDGVLRELQHFPRVLQNSLISRVKILADMDIAERRVPQDGRFMVSIGGRQLDVRVSTLPTQYGEKVVMRLLESQAAQVTLAELGFPPKIEKDLLQLLSLPQGLLLVTGPTGSGKSTTLYAALHLLRKPSVNIVTVEEPIEYVLPGVNQVQVNTRAGLTFVSCLRSILRQDPNIIMIGEIRDRETAEIAMKAAQTGHLVLSTLHTNDSVSAIIRLLDLQIPAYLIAASLTGILAQRLLRRLCVCRKCVPSRPEFRAQLAALGIVEPIETEYLLVGCDLCERTGFKTRVGIYELLVVDDAVRAAIRDNANIRAVQDAARARGLRLMQEDAIEKVRAGITTLEEALRVVPFEPARFAECRACGQGLVSASSFCPHCGATQAGAAGHASTLIDEGVLH